MLFLSFYFFILLFFINFKFKLTSLIILEGCMIVLIFFYFNFFFNMNTSSFLGLIVFSVFMVIDSILGLSNLIFSFRNSSKFSPMFFSF